MVLDAVSNFVRGNTDAEVGTDDTTVSVADASIFPDPGTDGEFNVVIWDVANFPRPDQDGDVEIMRVTARDTGADELTVTRGQEMTSAAAHPEGSAIHLSPTAKMFSDIESTFGDFWDAGAQELTADVNNTNTTTTALEAEDVGTERIGRSQYHYAGDYDGNGPNERLDAAINASSAGDAIYLENARYDESRTVDKSLRLIGSSELFEGTEISDDDVVWTFNARVFLEKVGLVRNAKFVLNERSVLSWIYSGGEEVEVNGIDTRIIGCRQLDVIFAEDTSGGIVDASTGVTVTDNGNNTVGDIA